MALCPGTRLLRCQPDRFPVRAFGGGERGRVRRVYEDHNLLVLWGVTLMAVPGVSSVAPAFPRSVNEFRGAFMATNGMALRTGQTVGPLLMASLAEALGAASIALVAFLLALVLVRQLSDDTTLPVAAAPHSRLQSVTSRTKGLTKVRSP